MSIHDDVTNLSTTSAKVRALAAKGMARADIARFLGIRYQQVRNALVDKVLTGEPYAVRSTDAKVCDDRHPSLSGVGLETPTSSGLQLLDAGFVRIGHWRSCQRSGIVLGSKAPDEPGVYAFVIDGTVCYVGVTQRSLRVRLDGYMRGHEGQRTNARVKQLLLAALAEGREIEVLFATPPDVTWNGLPVNGVAGLEHGLIRVLQPAWNMLGVRK